MKIGIFPIESGSRAMNPHLRDAGSPRRRTSCSRCRESIRPGATSSADVTRAGRTRPNPTPHPPGCNRARNAKTPPDVWSRGVSVRWRGRDSDPRSGPFRPASSQPARAPRSGRQARRRSLKPDSRKNRWVASPQFSAMSHQATPRPLQDQSPASMYRLKHGASCHVVQPI